MQAEYGSNNVLTSIGNDVTAARLQYQQLRGDDGCWYGGFLFRSFDSTTHSPEQSEGRVSSWTSLAEHTPSVEEVGEPERVQSSKYI